MLLTIQLFPFDLLHVYTMYKNASYIMSCVKPGLILEFSQQDVLTRGGQKAGDPHQV